ncbi:uncharacterized protein THITE_108026 [Thermothielavioides terrestris NRRL 8126]|jgi:hypothetical protein|uniref:Uncharacterized protein n=1 Tax=Thermothielavioides terrestris (strain ATCC 38088 / NRRL 8126) TaxID=578455 RepID=G2QSH1_THETT|nr:uncharacterized protein THITE_108026 [Thermothielavioides terrestris NRRL 8126]AEO62652.1 hypothetical protein THITE_108026 [Thermothielavioides terrestris NRRL 8126]
MGAVVSDLSPRNALTLNWESRVALLRDLSSNFQVGRTSAFTAPKLTIKNHRHYIDHQDCKFLGRSQRHGFPPIMLCSGIASPGCVAHVIGGIALVNVESMVVW